MGRWNAKRELDGRLSSERMTVESKNVGESDDCSVHAFGPRLKWRDSTPNIDALWFSRFRSDKRKTLVPLAKGEKRCGATAGHSLPRVDDDAGAFAFELIPK